MVPTGVAQCILKDPAHSRRVRPHRWRDPAGDLLAHRVQVFEHSRARPIHVRPVFEDHVDERQPEERLTANRLDLWRGEQRARDRIGDLILDEIRALARPLREDDHLHVG